MHPGVRDPILQTPDYTATLKLYYNLTTYQREHLHLPQINHQRRGHNISSQPNHRQHASATHAIQHQTNNIRFRLRDYSMRLIHRTSRRQHLRRSQYLQRMPRISLHPITIQHYQTSFVDTQDTVSNQQLQPLARFHRPSIRPDS